MTSGPGALPPGYASGDDKHTLTLTHDQVLILFEFFERLEETDGLKYTHPAEWIALGRLTGQLESIPWELFDPRYEQLLAAARTRQSQGFEGHVPGLGHVQAEADGTITPVVEDDGKAASPERA